MEWQRFLEENNIHFVSRGQNTKRGEFSIHCPMCGEDDPSEHLGINPNTGHWGCLRDQSHRGKSPRTLVKAILGCSSAQAGLIVKQYSHADPDTLEGALAALEADSNEVISHDEDAAKLAKRQQAGPQFADFNKIKPKGITQRFWNYLASRDYEDPSVIVHRYNLRCALTGRYKDRIIIPVELNGELLGWTSRAIGAPKNAPRYLASSDEIKATLWNYDALQEGGDRLIIVEGPFDAIKLDNYNFICQSQVRLGETHRPLTFRATCTFGTSVTMSQYILIRALMKRFSETWILFDKGAEGPASELSNWTGAKLAYLPHATDDPGEMRTYHIRQLASRMFVGFFREATVAEMLTQQVRSKKKQG